MPPAEPQAVPVEDNTPDVFCIHPDARPVIVKPVNVPAPAENASLVVILVPLSINDAEVCKPVVPENFAKALFVIVPYPAPQALSQVAPLLVSLIHPL